MTLGEAPKCSGRDQGPGYAPENHSRKRERMPREGPHRFSAHMQPHRVSARMYEC